MSTIKVKDADLADVYFETLGAGTEGDPYRMVQSVELIDNVTPLVNLYFQQGKGAPTTLTAPVAIDDTTFDVADATNYAIGDYIGVFTGVSGEGRFFFAEVLNVVSLTITVDTPFDFAFQSGDPTISSTINLAVDGSSTPQTFIINGTDEYDIHINRVIFTMSMSSTPDDGLFGNIAKLTKGVVIRKTDGVYRNLINIKDNGELATLAYDLVYTTKSGGGGTDGMRCRYTFAGPTKQGAGVVLSAGESLEIIIQDNISAITRFRVLAEGHISEL
jgi:hypothetical protein